MVGPTDREGGLGRRRVWESVAALAGERGEHGVCVRTHSVRANLPFVRRVRSGDAHRVAVVRCHDDQRVGVLLLEAARNTDSVVKFDVVVDRPHPVHRVELLVNRSRLNHQEEAIRVCREGINRPSGHFWQARLVGELA